MRRKKSALAAGDRVDRANAGTFFFFLKNFQSTTVSLASAKLDILKSIRFVIMVTSRASEILAGRSQTQSPKFLISELVCGK